MKKIILDLAVTLDGFIEGPKGEVDWCILDDDMNFDAFIASIDTIFYGRVSYDLWGKFMPDDNSSPQEKTLWKTIHEKRKYVFSRQKKTDDIATCIQDNVADAVKALQQQEGKNIWLYGGASLIETFIESDLVDIYRLSVHPIVLGAGKPLFHTIQRRINLHLTQTNTFKSGVVQLIYERQQ